MRSIPKMIPNSRGKFGERPVMRCLSKRLPRCWGIPLKGEVKYIWRRDLMLGTHLDKRIKF